MIVTAPIIRLLRKVTLAPDGGCWLWAGAKNPKGYGRVKIDGRWLQAHRVSYEHFVGPIPSGLQLDHLCRNRACIRPDYLGAVTCAENIRRGKTGTNPNSWGNRWK